jgi:hypothetical protein
VGFRGRPADTRDCARQNLPWHDTSLFLHTTALTSVAVNDKLGVALCNPNWKALLERWAGRAMA